MSSARKMRAIFYRSASGDEPVRDWLKALDKADRQAIGEDIAYIQRTQEVAQGFLTAASAAATALADAEHITHNITLYPAVPMSMQRVANVERAQTLIESPSRAALQRFLTAWQAARLHSIRQQPEGKGLIRWRWTWIRWEFEPWQSPADGRSRRAHAPTPWPHRVWPPHRGDCLPRCGP